MKRNIEQLILISCSNKITVSQNNFCCILTSERTGGMGLELRASLFIVSLGYNGFKNGSCLVVGLVSIQGRHLMNSGLCRDL